jgi:pimeloyl-ACP methyl ester carboxylesterase
MTKPPRALCSRLYAELRPLPVLLALSVAAGCGGEFDEGWTPASDDNELVSQHLFSQTPSPTAPDQNVTIQRLAYRCGFLNTSICDNTDSSFGAGVEHLRLIPKGDKEDIFVAFPNGHPSNPATIVFLSAGMQDIDQDGYLDTMTGQQDDWRPSGNIKSGTARILGNSLWGRLKADPRVASWGTSYVISVFDNGAGWSDPSSATIHEKFARFVRAKVGTSTKRVILAGYSRGGIMAVEMARRLRTTSDMLLGAGITLYTGSFDPVAGGGGLFGVNNTRVTDNPLIDNGDGPDFMKETSAVEEQIPASQRKNLTFFYNDVSGGRVAAPFSTIHGFGSVNYDLIPSYWTERWNTVPHSNYKDLSQRAQLLDPFLRWLGEMDAQGRTGTYTTSHNDVWVLGGAQRTLYLEAKSGSPVTFQVTWDASVYVANLDLDVYSSDGIRVASGRSDTIGKEAVQFTAPRTDTYRVVVSARSGGAVIRVSHSASFDTARTGYIFLPRDLVNAQNDYTRSYVLPTSPAGRAINLELTWADPAIDLDLSLSNAHGDTVAFSNSIHDSERISYRVPGFEGPYTVRVKSYSGVDAQFELKGTAPLLQ